MSRISLEIPDYGDSSKMSKTVRYGKIFFDFVLRILF